MPRTNPSQHLTLARVDQIANLVLKGERYLTKKEKPLWPTPKEAWQINLGGWSSCLDYLNGRDDLHFNSGQRSRRAAKLAEGLERLRVRHRVDNDFVWRVKHGWSSAWGHVCAPSEAAAKQIGHTMFVMGDPERLKVTPDRLTAEKLSLGGWDVAAKYNLEMITQHRNSIQDNKNRIEELQKRIDRDNVMIESLMGAVMLGGDLGGGDEETKAG
jgi:hypothetical protein